MAFTLKKTERLKSRKIIGEIFTKGRTLHSFPIKLYYLEIDDDKSTSFKYGVSVAKRKFKLAVHRNRIKRLLREVIRQHKIEQNELKSRKYALMFLYIGDELPNFNLVEKNMVQVLEEFKKVIQ